MQDTNKQDWTIWVFAGPGALFGNTGIGQPAPLAEVVGKLPRGVAVLAETVAAPTLLQQLTGEWPTQRSVLGLDGVGQARAERDLERFLEWADANTPKGSKRALIILGDLLAAIGATSKALVPGSDRPPYPTTIKIRTKPSGSQGYSESKYTKTDNTYGKKTFESLITGLAVGDLIQFDNSGNWYMKTAGVNAYTQTNENGSPVQGAPNTDIAWVDGTSLESDVSFISALTHNISGGGDYRNYYITHTGLDSQVTIAKYDNTSRNSAFKVVSGLSKATDKSFQAQNQPGSYLCVASDNSIKLKARPSGDTTAFDQLATFSQVAPLAGTQGFYSYSISISSTIHYIRHRSEKLFADPQPPLSDPLFNEDASFKVQSAKDLGNTDNYLLLRSIDAAGPVDVDTASRRIDAIASALDDLNVELIVSDNHDITQLFGLRQLAGRHRVVLGATQLGQVVQPFPALLDALRSGTELSPGQLATKVVETCEGMVALQGAPSLLHAVNAIASAAQAAVDAPIRRAVAAAWSPSAGGTLANLITQLELVGAPQAAALKSAAAAMVIAPTTSTGGEIGLGRGLQLGPVTPWVRLLDQISGYANADVIRSTLADLQSLTNTDRKTKARSPKPPSQPVHILEYAGPNQSRDDLTPARHFARFLDRELLCCPARHLVLLVRGKFSPARPGSVCFGDHSSLPISALARRLQAALDRRGHGPVAILLFEDPELLRIENAYELRNVARCLLTAEAGKTMPTLEWLRSRATEVTPRCEQKAADAVATKVTDSIAPIVDAWRHDVAVRLAKLLITGDGDDPRPVTLQGVDLSGIEALCRLFDQLCDRTYRHLDDPLVLTAINTGADATNMIEWINQVQMDGFHPSLAQASKPAKQLYFAWGEPYNWISQSATAEREGGRPLWLLPGNLDDRDPAGYVSRLRISVGPQQPKDYRSLSFHQAVSLHALLTAARLLQAGGGPKQWGLIRKGLAYASSEELSGLIDDLVQDPNAAHYYDALGTPPLLSLSIENTGSTYDLRLTSSDAQAVLLRHTHVVDLSVVERSLEGLAYVMSRSMASREGMQYLQGIGASLAEDVVTDLRRVLEFERKRMHASGRASEAHLALQLPRELMRYPWELMQLPDMNRGTMMLAEHFAVGRQMWSDREVPRTDHDGDIRILVIANPKTSLGPDLPAAKQEGQALVDLCAQLTAELDGKVQFVVDASIDEQLTRTILRQRLRNGNYDVIHFAGHGEFDAKDPDHSGWALTDGLLTVTELRNTLSSCAKPPWLIYANACSVGMIDTHTPREYHGDVYGMADACILAGVGAYVAPLWRIHDASAKLIGGEFYRRLLLEGETIGAALQQARMRTCKVWEALRGDTGLGDISWAGMVLFGNPTARIRERSS